MEKDKKLGEIKFIGNRKREGRMSDINESYSEFKDEMKNFIFKRAEDKKSMLDPKVIDHLFFEFQPQLSETFEKEVIGFLNTSDGGVIIIGVNEKGKVLGINEADILQLKIKYRLKNNISPTTTGLFDVAVETQNSKKTIKIMIASGREKPYYLSKKGMSSKGCFIRINKENEPMDDFMIKNLFAKRAEHSICNIKSRYQKLTFEQLKSYYQTMGSTQIEQPPKDLDLFTKERQYNYCAYLLSDKNDCSIKIDEYKGTNRVNLIENEELGLCCIVKSTIELLDKLKIKTNPLRDKSDVEIVAVREAVINAIVHNDYSSGIPPKFELFSDRIEITSVGAIAQGLSEENFFMGRCAPYNKELMRVFRDLGWVAQKGAGIKLILQNNPKSVYHFSENNIRIVLPYSKAVAESQSNITAVVGSQSNITAVAKSQSNIMAVAESQSNIMAVVGSQSKLTLGERTQFIKYSKKILLFCREPKSRKSIQEHLKLKNRDHFRKKILLPLIESKQLLLTHPDKPTSPNQQFYTA